MLNEEELENIKLKSQEIVRNEEYQRGNPRLTQEALSRLSKDEIFSHKSVKSKDSKSIRFK